MSTAGLNTMMRFLGRKLKTDLFNHLGTVVLPAGTILTMRQLERLVEHDIRLTEANIVIDIRNEGELLQVIDQAVFQVQSVFDEIRATNKIPISDVRDHIIPSIYEAAEHRDIFKIFASLQAKDDYTYRHNFAVGVIATLLGRWLNLSEHELAGLTIAATLHDVGKMRIPVHILTKPGKLTPEEYNLIKKHTVFGYDMIKSTTGASETDALVALQHHERQDGTGYPYNLYGNQIHDFSRIVAVADVFHAMTSKRSYRNPSPFYHILREMHDNRFGAFDPKVISVFLERMMPSLIGNRVQLTDQREGVVIMIHAHDPIRPLVQVGSEYIDLSRERTIQIEKVMA